MAATPPETPETVSASQHRAMKGSLLAQTSYVRIPNPQCVLNALLIKGKLPKKETYETFGRLVGGAGAKFVMSSLNRVEDAETFFRMTALERAALVPYVRLFITDRDGSSREIPFSMGDTSISKGIGAYNAASGKGRNNPLGATTGVDVGLTSVSVEDLTSQPEEEGSHLTVKVSLFLKSLRAIADPLPGTKAKITDLIQRSDPNDPLFDPQDNRIKLIMGWSNPSRVPSPRNAKIQRICKQSRLVLDLVLKDHTFTLEQNGNVNLDIEYNAAADGFLRCHKTNVLAALNKEDKKKVDKLEKDVEKLDDDMAKLKDDLGGSFNPEAEGPYKELSKQRDAAQKRVAAIIDENNTNFYKSLSTILIDKGYMKRVDVPSSLLDLDSSAGSAKSFKKTCAEVASTLNYARARKVGMGKEGREQLKKQIEEASGKEAGKAELQDAVYDSGLFDAGGESATSEATLTIDGQTTTLTKLFYYRFGHIVDAIHKAIIDNKKKGEESAFFDQFPYLLLGPVDMSKELCIGSDGKASISTDKQINIADVPVEVTTFLNWFANRFMRSGTRHLTYMTFINALVKELLPKALGEGENCFSSAAAPVIYPTLTPLTCRSGLPTFGAKYPYTIGVNSLRNHIVYDKNYKPKISKGQLQEVILVTGPEVSSVDLKYSKKENLRRGIYNIIPGEANGLLLNFSFSKNNQPFLAEAKVYGDGNIGQGEDISGGNVYNVNLDLMGNTFFRVGGIFFMDMIGLGLGNVASKRSLARKLYIGGYYVVTKLKYDITLSDFITTLEGVYTPGGGAEIAAQRKQKIADIKRRNEEIEAQIEDLPEVWTPPDTGYTPPPGSSLE